MDKKVAKGIKKDWKESEKDLANFPDWNGIRKLTREQNRMYQDCASEIARREGTLRVLLDLKYWKR